MTETAHAANADQGELEKFAALAHHWWDENGALAPLHAINPLRLEWIESIAPLAGQRVLDVGCGGGILADAMARRGAAEVLGIDLVAKSIKVARLHALEAGTLGVSYRVAAAEELAAEAPASFDL
ncbi:MAG: 3-demethylubiquinone-9 3-O-methyltransferase, partial [Ottowia sp.]|nr:3-demethylubiquinone-9 3-O-methyltransferase [Ottowia sp.]